MMKVAVGSDEHVAVNDAVVDALRERGHDVVLVGPIATDDPEQAALEWPAVGRRVGELVASGECDTAVLFCWTGTGASIAANKVPGVRAALCTDAETASGARRWNDANVLVMSNRLASPAVASEMLDAWFATEPDPSEAENVAQLDG